MYKTLRQLLFLFPAETAHYVSMNTLKAACSLPFGLALVRRLFSPAASLHTQQFGLSFKNKVGLGAGFDKNARYLRELEALGFGFVEIGTVTPRPQAGNSKPRLFRLPKDAALINRMGFNNEGVEAVAQRLKRWRKKQLAISNKQLAKKEASTTNYKPQTTNFLIGGNIGKNKATPNEDAWQDYEICFRALHPYVDFFVVNVSSPNTPGLRELQEKDSLHKILTHLQALNTSFDVQRPVLLKIAPDLTLSQIDDVMDLATEIKLDGLVATNTTISRQGLSVGTGELVAIGSGGLSGAPLKKISTDVVRYIHEKTAGSLPIIGSGGVFTAADGAEKIQAGASLVEVWTGFIYEGPLIVKNICAAIH